MKKNNDFAQHVAEDHNKDVLKANIDYVKLEPRKVLSASFDFTAGGLLLLDDFGAGQNVSFSQDGTDFLFDVATGDWTDDLSDPGDAGSFTIENEGTGINNRLRVDMSLFGAGAFMIQIGDATDPAEVSVDVDGLTISNKALDLDIRGDSTFADITITDTLPADGIEATLDIDVDGSIVIDGEIIANKGGSFTANSPLTISADITVGASTTFTAGDSAAVNDDIVIDTLAVVTLDTATNDSTLEFVAGDDIIFDTGSVVTMGTGTSLNVVLTADNEGAGIADGDRGSVTNSASAVTTIETVDLTITAFDGIGDSSVEATAATDPFPDVALRTEVETLDAMNTGANDILIAETDAIDLVRVHQTEDDNISVIAGGAIDVVATGTGVIIDDATNVDGDGTILLRSTAGDVQIHDIIRNDSDGADADIEIDANGTNSDVNIEAVVSTAAGDITITADDAVTFTATGDVTATGAGNVSVTSNTDSANGDSDDVITMADGTVIDGGSGTITLSAVGADGGNITLGSLTTTNATAGAVDIDTSAAVNDAGDTDVDIVANTAGAQVTIDAVTGIGSADDIETTINALDAENTASGDINIDETDDIDLVQVRQAEDDNISVIAGGTLDVVAAGTGVVIDDTANADGDGTILLRSEAGNVEIHDIVRNDSDGAAANITLDADGATSDVNIEAVVSTAAGEITITADDSITFTAAGDVTATGAGDVTATATTGAITMADGTVVDAGTGTADFDAAGDITLGSITTTGAAEITSSAGAVVDGGDTDVDIVADSADIDAVTGIGSADDIETTLGSLDAVNTTSGDINIDETDAIDLVQVRQAEDDNISVIAGGTLDVVAAGTGVVIDDTANADGDGTILLRSEAGNVEIHDIVRNDSDGAAANITLDADGATSDVNIEAVVSTAAGEITITADDSITFTAAGDVTATGAGDVSVTSNTDAANGDSDDVITMADGTVIDGGSGTITLSAVGADGGDITLGSLTTTNATAGAVDIDTTASVVDGGETDIDIVTTSASALVDIDAGGSIGSSGADIFTLTGFDPIEVSLAGDLTATATDVVAISGTIGGTTAITATTGILQSDGDLDISSGVTFTVTNLAVIADADNNGTGTLTIGPTLAVAGDLRVQGNDVVATDGTIDLIATRLLFVSGSSETIATTVDDLDIRTGGDMTVVNTTALELIDLDGDDIAALTTIDAGSIDISTTAAGFDLTVTNDVIAGPVAGHTSTGTIQLTGDNVAINDVVLADDANINIDATTDVTFTATGIIATDTGSITVDAGGVITMTDGSKVIAGRDITADFDPATPVVTLGAGTTGGTIDFDAVGDITLASLQTNNATAAAVAMTTTTGAVIDGGDTDVDILANETGGQVTIDAVTGIGSADDIETTVHALDAENTTSGDINIDETDAINLVQVRQAEDDNISVIAGGTLDVVAAGTGVVIDDTANADGDGTILLRSEAGNVEIHDIVRNDSDGAAANITLDADGATSDVNIEAVVSTAAGEITIIADDSITFTAAGDVTATGAGDVTATATTGAITMADGTVVDAGTGTADFDAAGDITLGSITTTGAAEITSSAGAVVDGGDTDVDIVADSADIDAVTGIGSADDIETTLGSLDAVNTTSGDINIDETDDIDLVQVRQAEDDNISVIAGGTLDVVAAGTGVVIDDTANADGDGSILLRSEAGNVEIHDIVRNDSDGAAANITLDADGATSDVNIEAVVSTAAGEITIIADDSITFTAAGDVTATGAGDVTATATTGAITMADGTVVDAGTGTADFDAAGDITLGSITTTGAAEITSSAGAVVDGGDTDVDIVADSADIDAVTGIGSADDIETTLGSLDAVNTTSGDINIDETDAIDLVQVRQAEDDNISVIAGGTLDVVAAGTGVVIDDTANADGDGTILLRSEAGNVEIHDIVRNDSDGAAANITLDADGATSDVNIEAVVSTAAGEITITADDSITFTAAGDVTATGAGDVSVTSNTDAANGDSDDVITMADGTVIDGGSGTITLSAVGADGGDITLGSLTTTNATAGAVDIDTTASVVDGGETDIDIVTTSASALVDIDAGGSIGSSGADIFTLTGFDPIEVSLAGDLTATATDVVAISGTIGGTTAITATTGILQSDGDLDISSGVTFTVTNLAVIADADNNGTGTLTIGPTLAVAGDLRVQGNDVVATDGTIDLIATRLLFVSGSSETIATTVDDLDIRTGGDMTVVNTTALELIDLDGDDIAALTTIDAGSIDISTTAAGFDLTVTNDVIAGPVAGHTSTGTIQLTGDNVAINDVVLADDANINIDATTDVTFTATGIIATDTGSITVDAGGVITMTDGSKVIAGRDITADFDPATPVVTLGAGTTGGTIDFDAVGDITLASLQTNNATAAAVAMTTTTGAVIDGGDTDVDILANETGGQVTIDAVTGIGSADDIETTVHALDAENTTSGDINIDETDAINLVQVRQAEDDNISVIAGGTLDVVAAGTGVVIDDTANADGDGTILLRSEAGNVEIHDIVRNDSDGAAANITLDADGATSDVNIEAVVSTAAGEITITADDSITFTAAGDVTATGAGDVTATATTGAITMADGTVVDAGTGTADFDAAGDITLGSITTTGAAEITSSAGAVVDGGDTDVDIVADSADIDAVTGIGSADDIETTLGSLDAVNTTSGDINIDETDDIDLVQVRQAEDDNISVIAGGTLDVVAAGTGVVIDDTANADGDGTILLRSEAGNVEIHDIVRNDSDGAAANITLDADGATSDVNIEAVVSTAAGEITITADDSITFTAAGDVTATGAGDVTATATTGAITMADGTVVDAGTGTADFDAAGDITLGSITTTGAAEITSSAGAVVDGGDTDVDIVADSADIDAVTGIGSADDIETTLGSLDAVNTTSGDINIDETDAIDLVQVRQAEDDNISVIAGGTLDVVAAGTGVVIDDTANADGDGSILLRSEAGNVEIHDIVRNDSDGAAANITLDADGATSDVNIEAVVSTAAGEITIIADDSITFTAAGDVTATGAGDVTATATTGAITMADGTVVDAGTGTADFDAAGDITLGSITTTGAAEITSSAGAVVDGGDTDVDIVADSADIDAVTGIGSADDIETTLGSLDAVNTTSGDINIDETDDIDLVQVRQAEDDNISVIAGGTLDVVAAGTGVVIDDTANADGDGTILLRSEAGNVEIHDIVRNDSDGAAANITLDADGATSDVNIEAVVSTAAGDITITADDAVTFNAAGDVTATGTSDVSVTSNTDLADGNSGDGITMADGTVIDSGSGTITLSAVGVDGGDITLGSITTTNATAGAIDIDTSAAVVDAGDTDVDIVANAIGSQVTIDAASGIGSADDIETTIHALDAENTTSGDIDIDESDAINLIQVRQNQDDNISVIAVGELDVVAIGSGVVIDDDANADGDGSILLRSETEDVQVHQIVRNDSDGTAANITLDADGTDSDVNIEAVVSTAAGDITITSDDAVTFTATGDVTATGAGNASVTSNTDAADGNSGDGITMADGTVIDGGSGSISLSAVAADGGDITLGSLTTTNATAGAVDIDTSAAVLDGGDTDVDIVANASGSQVTIDAVTGIGSADPLETTIHSLDATTSGTGDIWIDETDAIVLADVDTADGKITVDAAGTIMANDVATAELAEGATDNANIELTSDTGAIAATTVSSADNLILTSSSTITDTAGAAISADGDASFVAPDSVNIADSVGDTLAIDGNASFLSDSIAVGQDGVAAGMVGGATSTFGSLTLNTTSGGDAAVTEDNATLLADSSTIEGDLSLSSSTAIRNAAGAKVLVESGHAQFTTNTTSGIVYLGNLAGDEVKFLTLGTFANNAYFDLDAGIDLNGDATSSASGDVGTEVSGTLFVLSTEEITQTVGALNANEIGLNAAEYVHLSGLHANNTKLAIDADTAFALTDTTDIDILSAIANSEVINLDHTVFVHHAGTLIVDSVSAPVDAAIPAVTLTGIDATDGSIFLTAQSGISINDDVTATSATIDPQVNAWTKSGTITVSADIIVDGLTNDGVVNTAQTLGTVIVGPNTTTIIQLVGNTAEQSIELNYGHAGEAGYRVGFYWDTEFFVGNLQEIPNLYTPEAFGAFFEGFIVPAGFESLLASATFDIGLGTEGGTFIFDKVDPYTEAAILNHFIALNDSTVLTTVVIRNDQDINLFEGAAPDNSLNEVQETVEANFETMAIERPPVVSLDPIKNLDIRPPFPVPAEPYIPFESPTYNITRDIQPFEDGEIRWELVKIPIDELEMVGDELRLKFPNKDYGKLEDGIGDNDEVNGKFENAGAYQISDLVKELEENEKAEAGFFFRVYKDYKYKDDELLFYHLKTGEPPQLDLGPESDFGDPEQIDDANQQDKKDDGEKDDSDPKIEPLKDTGKSDDGAPIPKVAIDGSAGAVESPIVASVTSEPTASNAMSASLGITGSLLMASMAAKKSRQHFAPPAAEDLAETVRTDQPSGFSRLQRLKRKLARQFGFGK